MQLRCVGKCQPKHKNKRVGLNKLNEKKFNVKKNSVFIKQP